MTARGASRSAAAPLVVHMQELLGALINFQGDAFEYVNGSLTKSP